VSKTKCFTSLSEAQETCERLYSLIDSLTDYALFMLDLEGNVITWNAGASRITGYAEFEILGQHLQTFYTPEDREARIPWLEVEQAASAGRFEGEGYRVRKDGSLFWANEIIAPIKDESERIVSYTKIIRDCSHRKEMEDALWASEEKHRLLVENVQDYAIFMLDPHGVIVTWNSGAEAIFGYADEEIIGQYLSPLFTPEDRAAGVHEQEFR
jgi:PAS domain S-box-containing protein